METLLILMALPWLFLCCKGCVGWCWDEAGPSLTHTLPLGRNSYDRPGFLNPTAGLAFWGGGIWVPVPSHPPSQEPSPWRGGGGRRMAACRLLQASPVALALAHASAFSALEPLLFSSSYACFVTLPGLTAFLGPWGQHPCCLLVPTRAFFSS